MERSQKETFCPKAPIKRAGAPGTCGGRREKWLARHFLPVTLEGRRGCRLCWHTPPGNQRQGQGDTSSGFPQLVRASHSYETQRTGSISLKLIVLDAFLFLVS